MHYYPRLRTVYTWLGTLICFISLLAASYTTKVCSVRQVSSLPLIRLVKGFDADCSSRCPVCTGWLYVYLSTFYMNLTAPLAIVYAPVISYMSEWFVQRRGLANGILVAGMVKHSS